MHKLAKTLKTCDDAATGGLSQLCELSAQACSLQFHQVVNDHPGWLLCRCLNQEDLIPVGTSRYTNNTSALLVSL